MNSPIVIVDEASNRRYLPSEFEKLNISCIHVKSLSSPQGVEMFSAFAPDDGSFDVEAIRTA